MTTHLEAKAIVDALGISHGASLLVRGIAVLESHYGDGWKGAGKGSNNWGAVQAFSTWKGETFETRDGNQSGWYVGKFRKYPSPFAGAADLWRILSGKRHGKAVALAEQGDWLGVSRSLRESVYYEGMVPKEEAIYRHHKRLIQSLTDICRATGEVLPQLELQDEPAPDTERMQ